MTHTIKFRAFQDGEMYYQEKAGVYGAKHFFATLYEDCELMQYTGLKDKKGVEIYEGDVVTWSFTHKPMSSKKRIKKSFIFEIKWNQLECCFGEFTKHGFKSNLVGNAFPELGDISETDYEIIGNIHENTELIK